MLSKNEEIRALKIMRRDVRDFVDECSDVNMTFMAESVFAELGCEDEEDLEELFELSFKVSEEWDSPKDLGSRVVLSI
jgi:hypothetical protein